MGSYVNLKSACQILKSASLMRVGLSVERWGSDGKKSPRSSKMSLEGKIKWKEL